MLSWFLNLSWWLWMPIRSQTMQQPWKSLGLQIRMPSLPIRVQRETQKILRLRRPEQMYLINLIPTIIINNLFNNFVKNNKFGYQILCTSSLSLSSISLSSKIFPNLKVPSYFCPLALGINGSDMSGSSMRASINCWYLPGFSTL